MGYQLARRLRAPEKQPAEKDRRQCTNADSSTPTLARDCSESCSEGTCYELTKSNRHVVESNHAATVLGWCELPDVQRNNHGSATDSETNDETTNSELSDRVCCCLECCSNDENHTGGPDGHLSSKAISREACSNRADQSTATRQGSNQLLFARRELMAQGGTDCHQYRRDVSGVIAEKLSQVSRRA